MNELQMRMYQYKTQLKLTNKEIAKRTGFSVATIDRIAQGKIKAPKLDTIKKIADVFGVSVEELVGQDKAVIPCFFDKQTAQIAEIVSNNPVFVDLINECQSLPQDDIQTIIGMVRMLKK